MGDSLVAPAVFLPHRFSSAAAGLVEMLISAVDSIEYKIMGDGVVQHSVYCVKHVVIAQACVKEHVGSHPETSVWNLLRASWLRPSRSDRTCRNPAGVAPPARLDYALRSWADFVPELWTSLRVPFDLLGGTAPSSVVSLRPWRRRMEEQFDE